ncbi:MAG: hypothetical protein COA38_17690 [Fluviicola sp.]|nr:MAG: hypothetical protein COA38_17690 [Fluviicola sp.]
MKYTAYLILALLISGNAFGQQSTDWFLISRNTGKKVLSNGDSIRVFGFAQSLGEQPGVPGPTLFANEGDSVHIDVWNVSQGAPHSIHLHGLDVNQENDGVPHLSWSIGHMEHGYYHFKAPHAGTYLYHCHVASTIHVQAGMYGLIIIKPPDGSKTTWDGGYQYVNEQSYFLSEIDTNWHTDSVLDHDHDTTNTIHSVEVPKFEPQFFLINGLSDQQLVDAGESFNSAVGQVDYTRLANIGYRGVRVTFPPDLHARIISSDGRPLPAEEITDTVYVYPGERFGVLTDPSVEFTGQISFDYIDLNTMNVDQTQVIPVNVSGFADLDEMISDDLAFSIVPNPFDQTSTVQFHLSESKKVRIRILDLMGNEITNVQVQNLNIGKNSFEIGDELKASGLYLVQIFIDEKLSGLKKLIKL